MENSETTFDVAILLGDRGDHNGANRVETLKLPSPLTIDRFTAALLEHNITAADVRTRLAILSNNITRPEDAAIIYAVLAGFTGRFVPASFNGQTVENEPEITLPATDKPEGEPLQELLVSDTAEAADIRFARHINIPNDQSPADTAATLAKVVLIRRRGTYDRYPYINDINLEEARLEGSKLRSESRGEAVASVAERVPPTARLVKLHEATGVPISEVLRRLGAKADEETGERWHCPRPWNHTNGDKNPSMRITGNRTRCFRCDPEWSDSLRIVMSARNCTSDEAADWILSGEELPPHTY